MDGRLVSAVGQSCTETDCDPSESASQAPVSPFVDFDATVSAGDGGGASQDSSVDAGAGTMTAAGSASSFSDIGYGQGTSTFEIQFQLTSAMDITRSGLVEADEFFGFGEGRAEVRLVQGVTTLYAVQALVTADFASETVSYQATLGPGTYTLEAVADGSGGSFSTYDLSFSATPVPEPGTAALAAAGLLALAALRRGASRTWKRGRSAVRVERTGSGRFEDRRWPSTSVAQSTSM